MTERTTFHRAERCAFGLVGVGLAALVAVVFAAEDVSNPATAEDHKPSIVLVHGAFADSSSWKGEFMSARAGSKETVVLAGTSHVLMISNPHAVAALIERAASGR